MTVHLIELSDQNIRISQVSPQNPQVLIQSPGFANTLNSSAIFGKKARQISRLHPRHSYNQFWSQLSLDPLVNSSKDYRHQADLAYSHLNELLSVCESSFAGPHNKNKDEIIFAVPSHYNRNQLSILLGLANQYPFKPIALVDLALLNIAEVIEETAIYFDLQLHQTVLTLFSIEAERIIRKDVRTIPGAGLLTLHDAWANLITDEFIKQCRFDPQHNAETEQYVYDQLHIWLSNGLLQKEVLLEINNKGTVHQASINLENFEKRAINFFTRIKTEIATISSPTSKLYLPADIASTPGLVAAIPDIISINNLSILKNVTSYAEQLKTDPKSLGFTTSLSTIKAAQFKSEASCIELPLTNNLVPSHILIDHKAYPLSYDQFLIGAKAETNPLEKTNNKTLNIDHPDFSSVLTITCHDHQYTLEHNNDLNLCLNNKLLHEDRKITIGDSISVSHSNVVIQLIQVQ